MSIQNDSWETTEDTFYNYDFLSHLFSKSFSYLYMLHQKQTEGNIVLSHKAWFWHHDLKFSAKYFELHNQSQRKAKRKQWQNVVVLVSNNIKTDILNTDSSVDTDIEAIGILLKDVKTSQIISTFLNNIWNNRIM